MTTPTRLTDTLWLLPSRAMRYNAGLLASGGQVWLIDPGPHPDETAAAADLAAGLGAIARIVLTHSHWDHILGPERLPGAPTLAHELFAPTLERNSEGTLAMIARWEARHGYHQRAAPFRPPQVDAEARDGDTARLGELELQLIHIPGHAADQLAVFEPASGALWAADTLSDAEIPFVSHSLAAYEAALAKLAALPIRALVPGHGAPSADPAEIRGRLDADRRYLAELRARVARVEEAVAACADLVFREPAENAGPHRLNVESAYIELGGPADPDRVGWSQKGLIDE